MTLELNIFHLNNKHKLVEDENQRAGEVCNTPKYTLVVFDKFRVFCKPNLTVS